MALVMAPEAGRPLSRSNLALFSVLSCHPSSLSSSPSGGLVPTPWWPIPQPLTIWFLLLWI